ncbi:RecQ family ATP-dependent DNA helicase [Bacillus coahuilensis]|uniref:RecQ family ATP-dependent DNA helicase n=1 Tax=Bacillus coahuilensis TaxID=408580 RepID=UPI0001850E27|nr:ATP-dependent DNA helicase RecQ [Bacillus coahuilensis]
MSIIEILKQKFGYDTFRVGQEDVILSVLKGQDTVALLPTGTGKSLCYQLPSYMMEGTTLIVSPLLSLMQDQVEQMKVRGEKSVLALNSFLTADERKLAFKRLHTVKFLFVSPEILQNDYILRRIKQLSISLFVIDEAHCISQWGPDFRPDYMLLGDIKNQLNNPTTLALTATATMSIREDIINQLNLVHPNELIYSVDRPNIAINIIHVEDYKEKVEQLISLVNQLNGPGIVYFSSRKLTEEISERLNRNEHLNVAFYHGEMDQEQRTLIQQQFIYNELDVICATSAFGMGINKENVRFVIHFHMPSTVEAYLQEIGRAGRDGKQSISILLSSDYDESLPLNMIENELPSQIQIERFFQWNSRVSMSQEEYAGLNNVQFRMLSHYDTFLGNKDSKEKIYIISQRIEERKNKKIHQLFSMIRWKNSVECRREGLLRYFDEQLKSKPLVCCDRCGINENDFYKSNDLRSSNKNDSWKDRLDYLYRQGK